MLFRQASLAHAVKIGSTPLKKLVNIKYVKKKKKTFSLLMRVFRVKSARKSSQDSV